MDVTLINPFINATVNVLETMASISVKTGRLYLKEDNVAVGDVSGVLGLTGGTNGTLSISFENDCIQYIVSNMLNVFENASDEGIADAVGELTNMISGQARYELEEMGIVSRAGRPTVITGRNHSIRHYIEGPIIAIPFSTESGKFTIEVCFEHE